ncbi:MAG: hypothetical protein ACYDHN_02875 [Solirubrobacteraceae bacterium]
MRTAAGKRVAIAAATAVLTFNIWTGAPLAAMWVGSKVAGAHPLSMLGVCTVVVALAALDFSLTMALTWLNNLYRELAGMPPTAKREIGVRMRAETDLSTGPRRASTLEGIVVLNVYVAFAALVIWYVFFAAAPSSLML